ncbi:membrane fusogenic activity family protein [Nocardiopsis aegyptia]|uniref:membrane fusogenic activity family protein n=1 Tax=Nocardiopsis aegyptia TaxID=220378 RepID=UPI0036721582
MVVDAVRTYFDATSGLTELSRKEAVAAAKALLKANGRPTAPAADQEALPARVGQSIQALAGELIATNEANRTAIADLVRSEVAHQLERMDIVPRPEYERVVRRVAELERRLAARHMADRVPVTEVPVVAATAGTVVGGASAEDTGTAERPVAAAPEASADDSEDPAPATAATAAVTATGTSTDSAAEAVEGDAAAAAGNDAEDGPASESGNDAEPEAGAAGGTKGVAAKGAEGTATARKTTSRSKPRTTTKSARARSTPKRTTKAKGSTGKGPTKK